MAFMKAMKATKSMKKTKSVIAKGRGAKARVFAGKKAKTSGGLTKATLKKNKNGKVVSKKASDRAKKNWAKSGLKAGANKKVQAAAHPRAEEAAGMKAKAAASKASQKAADAQAFCFNGVKDKKVCCASSCGECGGTGCGQRPGGASKCCSGAITSNGRVCASVNDVVCLQPEPEVQGAKVSALPLSSTPAAGSQEADFRTALARAKLEMYADVFADNGWDNVADYPHIPKEALVEMGLKDGCQFRFRKAFPQ